MQKHNINGWDVYHEQKHDAPPIISVRMILSQNPLHAHKGFSAMYIQMLRQMISKESVHYSLAGAPTVSWAQEYINIGVTSLEEDLEEFLILIQKVLHSIPSPEMLAEELRQQHKLDEWNAQQPQELLSATLYEQYYGLGHHLCHDIDASWRDRAQISTEMFVAHQKEAWGATLFIVSHVPWERIESIVQTQLVENKPNSCFEIPLPNPHWSAMSIPCAASEQVGITIVSPARNSLDPLEKATHVGLMALAVMFQSRMNLKIRQEEGLSYGVDCHYIPKKQYGRIEFSCFSQPDQAFHTYQLMQKTIQEANASWTEEEIQQAKEQLIRNEKIRGETCAQHLSLRVQQFHTQQSFLSLEERCAQWQHVSLAQVQEVMREVSKAPQLVLCLGQEEFLAPFGFPKAPVPQKYIFEPDLL